MLHVVECVHENVCWTTSVHVKSKNLLKIDKQKVKRITDSVVHLTT